MSCFFFCRSFLTVIRNFLAILTYILDLLTDINLGVRYYTDEWRLQPPILWCIVTLSLVLLPALINAVINVFILCRMNIGVDIPKWTAIAGYVLSFLLLGPVWHNVVTMVKLCEGDVYASEDAEVIGAAQRTSQALLQSVPQAFFQIYLLGKINTVTPMQVLSIVTSLVSAIHASFIGLRVANRKYHLGNSDFTVMSLGSFWIALLLISGVPSVALISSHHAFGESFLPLVAAIVVYLLVLPVVIKTETVFCKIFSAFCQLLYTTAVAAISFLWYFHVKDFENHDSCWSDSFTVTQTYADDITEGVTTPLTTDLATEVTNEMPGKSDVTTSSIFDVTTPFVTETVSGHSTTDMMSLNSSHLRFLRHAEASPLPPVAPESAHPQWTEAPAFHLGQEHCLSDWSLVIIIVITSANALFFFYHMILILGVRLRQQVDDTPRNRSNRGVAEAPSPKGTLTVTSRNL